MTLRVTDDMPLLNVEGGSDTVTVEDEKALGGIDEVDGGVGSVDGTIVDNVNWGADGFGSATGFSVGQQSFTAGTTVYWAQNGGFLGTAASGAAASLLVNTNGTYTYTLMDNLLLGQDTQGEQTDNLATVSITGQDADGDLQAVSVTLRVTDDMPSTGIPQDAILVNELGNQVTGNLNFDIGADSNATYALLLTPGAPVMDANDTPVTSNGTPLLWSYNATSGIWSAETATHDTAFTIQANADGTYTVQLSDTVPLNHIASGHDIIIGGGISGGNADEYALFDVTTKQMVDVNPVDHVPDTAKHMIFLTATGESGAPASINTSSTIGVGTGQEMVNDIGSTNDANPSTSETLTIWFAEPQDPTLITNPASQLTTEPIESVTFGLSNWKGATGGHWVAYGEDANGNEIKVGEGGIAPNASSFLIDLDSTNDGTGGEAGGTVTGSFYRIELTADSTSSYKVSAITGVTPYEASNVVLDLTAKATDGDGDTAQVSFHVTFDADGKITGTDAPEVIAGSSHADVIHGGAGDDVIHGGAGDDTLFGGAGADTILANDGGHDTVGVGASDTITYDAGIDTLVPDPDDTV